MTRTNLRKRSEKHWNLEKVIYNSNICPNQIQKAITETDNSAINLSLFILSAILFKFDISGFENGCFIDQY